MTANIGEISFFFQPQMYVICMCYISCMCYTCIYDV